MVRQLVALTLAVFLALPACGFSASHPNSVQALQSKGDTFCTAWSVNEVEGLWATAAHCGAYVIEKQINATILGQPAYLVYMGFPAADVAVFQSAAHAPALRLAKHGAVVGDALYIIGYPLGITRTLTQGHMAARDIPIIHPSTDYYMTCDILDITTTGGNSGSPVFDSHGDVIGLLWGGFTESPLALAVPLGSLQRAIGSYFK